MKKYLLMVVLALLAVAHPHVSQGQAMRTGRSVALAGSGALAMYGVHAAGWNPANLGMMANPSFSFIVPSFGLTFGNNAFTPQYISDTFVEGKFLTDNMKSEILSKMDADQLKLYSSVGVPIFGFSIRAVSFNLDGHLLGGASIPSDLFELALTGPVKDKTYDLSTVEENVLGYTTASFSTAKDLANVPYMQEFSVGATFKYVLGVTYSELVEKGGTIQVNDSAIAVDGMYKILNSKQMGDGIGLDIGMAGRLDFMDLYVGMTLGNLIGNIKWGEVEVRENHFSHAGGVDMDRVSDPEYFNHFLTQADTVYTIDGVSTPLPRYLLLSADKSYLDGKGDLFFTYYQGLNETPGQNLTPRFAVGSEFRFIPVLPLRAGIALGGIEGVELGGGFGLRLLGYQLNLGASWHRGVAAGAQGFSFAVTNYFGPGFTRGDEDE